MNDADPGQLPDYATIETSLQRAGIQQCPAELHGFAVGMAAGGVEGADAIWESEVYAEFDASDVLAAECRRLLDRVFASATASDAETPMALSLLLPQDLVVDSARLAAMRDWVQGFLFGLGLAGESAATTLSPQARELLNDFDEISRVDTDDVDNTDESQAALIEIEEYLREGVMLIRDELADARHVQIAQTERTE